MGEEECCIVITGTPTLRTPEGERALGPWDIAWFHRGPAGAHGLRNDADEASKRTGDELIGASLYELGPGNQLWPYHFHVGNEEWIVVVSGTPTLRIPQGERELRAGDVVGFPQGEEGAHTFYNRSSAASRILFFSTLRSGYPTYPDSDKVAAGGRVFRRTDAVDYWDCEESRA